MSDDEELTAEELAAMSEEDRAQWLSDHEKCEESAAGKSAQWRPDEHK